LDEAAVAHDRDPVTESERFGEVVGDEDHRLFDLSPEADDLVLHVAPDQRIECGERLVEQHDLGVGGERSGEADALLHTTAQLVRFALTEARQTDEFEDLLGLGPPFVLRHLLHFEAERDVVDERAMGQQAEVLEDHAHPVAAYIEQFVTICSGDVGVADHHGAGGRLDQAGETSYERRLAAPGEPHHDEDFAGRYVEVDVSHRDDTTGLGLQHRPWQVGVGRTYDASSPGAVNLPQPTDRD